MEHHRLMVCAQCAGQTYQGQRRSVALSGATGVKPWHLRCRYWWHWVSLMAPVSARLPLGSLGIGGTGRVIPTATYLFGSMCNGKIQEDYIYRCPGGTVVTTFANLFTATAERVSRLQRARERPSERELLPCVRELSLQA
jgi:hypothetical protein